ncbi:MAG TPA: glycoside hydrolase family 16 protein, partial [Bacteroidales bacterium]|nr:glycoside hydrolase family 16 protein [Bacteroidales bacterium]
MKCLSRSLLLLAFIVTASACKNKEKPTEESFSVPEGWQQVWADEFNYTGLPDSGSWDYDIGGHGWGNNEKQFYTEARTENARVENGLLIIEARKEAADTNDYTSVRLVTRG